MQTNELIAAVLLTISVVPALAQTTKRAPLADQKMCDEQAHKRLNQYASERTVPERYNFQLGSSHYDPDLRTCYFHYSYQQTELSHVDSYHNVEDAFEGKGFGGFLEWQDIKTNKVQILLCYVKPVGQPEIKCDNLHDWFGLLEKYFGL